MVAPENSSSPGRREANKQEKRARILQAAGDIVASEGASKLTMRYLAETAGVSSRTPYNLFSSKTDILIQLFAELTDGLWPMELAEPPSGKPVSEAMLSWLDSLSRLTPEQDAYYGSILSAIMRSDEMSAKKQGLVLVREGLLPRLQMAQARGEINPDELLEPLAQHLAVLLTAIMGMWADQQISLTEALHHTRLAWSRALELAATG